MIERSRKCQLEAIEKTAKRYRFAGTPVSPAALFFLLNAIPRIMLMEADLGVFTGHAETLKLVEHSLDQIEPLKR